MACVNGHPKIVKFFFDRAERKGYVIDINSKSIMKDKSLLRLAYEKDHQEVVEVILEYARKQGIISHKIHGTISHMKYALKTGKGWLIELLISYTDVTCVRDKYWLSVLTAEEIEKAREIQQEQSIRNECRRLKKLFPDHKMDDNIIKSFNSLCCRKPSK